MILRQLLLLVLLFSTVATYAQLIHDVSGTIIDSTKTTLPNCTVMLSSDQKDSLMVVADVDGKFLFKNVKGLKITLTVSQIGYQTIRKHYTIESNGKPANLGNIVLNSLDKTLNEVTIFGANSVRVTEDTIDYRVSAYGVRENAAVEDVLKKLPGVEVDPSSGAVTAQGQTVTRARINGKDYMGGDVTSLTKNLPADMIESIQIVDDYGDQANLTGIRTGQPNRILNFTIRKDRNFGYSLQATGGAGSDYIPKNEGILNGVSPQDNDARYLGTLNYFKFKGDQQISVLGSLNNTNVNTFSFASPNGGGGNGGGRGGGGRFNAARGGGLTTNQNGITNAGSLGINFRDQWAKNLAVYGSYSFADNSTSTNSRSQQENTGQFPNSTNQSSQADDRNINHRLTWNMEWSPDSLNYFKITPSFSFSKTNSFTADEVLNQQTSRSSGVLYTSNAYNSTATSNSTSPNFGLEFLYNHKFVRPGRNLSVTMNLGSNQSNSSQNPIYQYTAGTPLAPLDQLISVKSRSNNINANFSYIEPLSKVSSLEFNYTYTNSYNASDKGTDTLTSSGNRDFYAHLSNNYRFNFITNRAGLNFRVIEKNYNYTVGLGVQPTALIGHSETTGLDTRNTVVNFAPAARFVYNFARSNSLSFNYNGSSVQPGFNQLQPVTDFSNALYPVQGNPDLKPAFNNNFSVRYNKFSMETGDVLFLRASFDQTSNQVSTNLIAVPSSTAVAAHPFYGQLQNTTLIQYLNTSGYYQASGFFNYGKPWAKRRYTLFFNTGINYTNNVGYVSSVDSNTVVLTQQQNIARNLQVSPGIRFRLDLPNIIDAQLSTSYAINKTANSVSNSLTQAGANVRTLTLGINGKNYFWKDWTLSYDFNRLINYGYTVPVTNPNILNAYLERRMLKNNAATLRASIFDAFNQNTGFSSTTTATSITQSNVNRLGRYFLLTLSLRLQKFSGVAPANEGGGDRDRNRAGGGRS